MRGLFKFTLRLHTAVLAGACLAISPFVAALAADGTAPRAELVFKVQNYGAVCDGQTDDTAAIQKAINAAESAGGGVVQFPGSVCLLDSCHPSSHPWDFYNLIIGSGIKLRGTNGSKLLQGPGGRHPLPAGAREVGNSVLAFGLDYEVIRFQNPAYNGGFYRLCATTSANSRVRLLHRSAASNFKAGDYVAIYQSTAGDVIPTETSRLASVAPDTGILDLDYPLARSFSTPFIANVTPIATKNVGVENLVVQGAEPLSVTETFGFKGKTISLSLIRPSAEATF
jgi:hypothetical protein